MIKNYIGILIQTRFLIKYNMTMAHHGLYILNRAMAEIVIKVIFQCDHLSYI